MCFLIRLEIFFKALSLKNVLCKKVKHVPNVTTLKYKKNLFILPRCSEQKTKRQFTKVSENF